MKRYHKEQIKIALYRKRIHKIMVVIFFSHVNRGFPYVE